MEKYNNNKKQNKKSKKEKYTEFSSVLNYNREHMINIAKEIGLSCVKNTFLSNKPESYLKLFDKIIDYFTNYYIETKETGQVMYSFYKIFIKKEDYVIPAAAIVEFFKNKKELSDKILSAINNIITPKIKEELSTAFPGEDQIEKKISNSVQYVVEKALKNKLYDFIIFVFTLSVKDDIIESIIKGRIEEIKSSIPNLDTIKNNISKIKNKKTLELLEEYYIYEYINKHYGNSKSLFIKILNRFFRRVIFYIFYYELSAKFRRSSADLLKCVGNKTYEYLKQGKMDFLGDFESYGVPLPDFFRFIFNNIVNHMLKIFPLKKRSRRIKF